MITQTLRNGTRIVIGPSWTVVTLPDGREVHAHPNPDSPRMALALGFGGDVAALTRDHDPTHARLTDWLGLPYSLSLMAAAGGRAIDELTGLEEEAVLAVQRYRRACVARGLLPPEPGPL